MANWFESWFDSEYYHILYQNRNDEEARRFLTRLTGILNIPPDSRILDLACGKGRHARYLNEIGFDVTGMDLSSNSISYASQFSNAKLRFEVGDMRHPLANARFQYVFNLFTSFGYFNSLDDNLLVMKAAHDMLEPNGILVIDFLNRIKVEQELVRQEVKHIHGIEFHITRSIEDGCVIKTIRFEHLNKQHTYSEKVQLLGLNEFSTLFQQSGFGLENVFGDYNLGTFAPSKSDRLILVARRK